ncbi:MAG: nucleotidyltransferase [Candidatus Moranbacteria bacterium]|nr:nucleotidyltransferase [Candidatus Moranbacteria bacterium]
MSKKVIKQKLLKAIENNPYKKDFKSISLFGSYAYGKPNRKSDIDLLIEFKPKSTIGFFELFEIQDAFIKSTGKHVDLATKGSLLKSIKKEILQNAEKIY